MTRSTSGGMVRQHPARGLWEARYTGADGRRHSLYAKTRKEAQERLRVALTEADYGIRPIGQRMTTGAYLDAWLAGSVRLRCRPRTADSYADTAERYIKPAIGNVPLAKLAPEHVARMLADLTNRGSGRRLSPTTVRYAHAVLRVALGRALKSGQVARNVAILVDAPARVDHEISPLTVDQVATFLDAIEGDRLRALYVAAIGTGLRQGELLGLRWADVDLDAATLAVRHTLQISTRTLADPKTDRARRTLSLPAEVLDALRDHRRAQIAERLVAGTRWVDGDFVFVTRQGRPLMARNVLRSLHAHLERAGLPRQRFHDLRHAYATLLLEDGEELGVISRTLGHSQIATTADVYAHLTPAMLERTAARMDGVLTRRKRVAGA
jgi:integrase